LIPALCSFELNDTAVVNWWRVQKIFNQKKKKGKKRGRIGICLGLVEGALELVGEVGDAFVQQKLRRFLSLLIVVVHVLRLKSAECTGRMDQCDRKEGGTGSFRWKPEKESELSGKRSEWTSSGRRSLYSSAPFSIFSRSGGGFSGGNTLARTSADRDKHTSKDENWTWNYGKQ
jgi:hypothetical protein